MIRWAVFTSKYYKYRALFEPPVYVHTEQTKRTVSQYLTAICASNGIPGLNTIGADPMNLRLNV